MLAHDEVLHKELFGGTRQRVQPKAEPQSLTNALVQRDRQQHPWPRSIDRDMAQNTPQVEKLLHQEQKKSHSPQLHPCPALQETQRSVDCMGKQTMAETETLRVCLNQGLKAQTQTLN